MSYTTELNEALQPLGLTARLFRGEEDLQANVDLNNVCARADGDEWVDTIEQARNWLANFDLSKGDPRTEMLFVETADGTLVGKTMVDWWKTEAGEWNYGSNCWVHPDWRCKGVGSALLCWTEGRSREMAANHDHNGAPAFFVAWAQDQMAGKVALLTGAGYTPIRHGYTMLRDLSEPIPDIPLPDGIEVRPTKQEHVRQIWEAFREAFRDHWGYSEWTDNDYQHFITWPEFNPALWRVAWQGDEVVGGCINDVPTKENEALGQKRMWLAQIAIRRPWRKQGIAKATMVQSMRLFREMGMTEAALGVDAQNPNGALQLYESMGFRVHKSGTSYRKPLLVSA